MEDASFAGVVFVPEVAELGVEPCYAARTPVTNAEFKEFVDAKGYETEALWDADALPLIATFRDGCPGKCEHHGPRSWKGGSFGDVANSTLPVRGVTLYEARAYARWRSKKGGRWRLPTAKEWEVAAGWDPSRRQLRAYPWGDKFEDGQIPMSASVPVPVGSNRACISALGLEDAGSNVHEWVERSAKEPGIKGASFASVEAIARRSALVRTTGTPGPAPRAELLLSIGFRLVRELEDR
jgi:formylglycine-generating enzyme required for sulfatase activity